MTDKPSFKDSVFLPKTDFPQIATHATMEPKILRDWQVQTNTHRPYRPGRFTLHDGPPYANGNIHMGHALNKILKDFVVRSQMFFGSEVGMIPGWDCHGLPIEWKVEEEMRAEGLDIEKFSIKYFRQRCRLYAEKWVDIQAEQFKRLGVKAEWDKPYLTLDFATERSILAELFKFAETGQLYRGAKPVMWSPVEKTSLAEAEVEHKEITSTQVDVTFNVMSSKIQALMNDETFFVVWTTTPWTLPVNQALAVGPDIDYVAVKTSKGSMIVAADLLVSSLARWGLEEPVPQILWQGKGRDFEGTLIHHPMWSRGGHLSRPRRVLMADFVTTETGTGVVHLAPDHGEDDFKLCHEHDIPPLYVVQGDGTYRDDWLWLGGQGSVINNTFNSPEGPVCADLKAANKLLAASKDYRHSYPHSWRSKAKIIFRTTPQWFIRVNNGEDDLKSKALAALDDTTWVPARSYNRIHSMVSDRPDWLISRQRRWGVPIALYVNKLTGEYLCDPEVNAAILRAVADKGADVWWEGQHTAFLNWGGHKLEDYEVVEDILDVWFDSGTSHSYVLDQRHHVKKADLYLEGSDQHRGWFQASLLASCGTRGFAPYETVMTHGFVLDKKGKKMAKSEGNVVDPKDVIDKYGADTLRLWVALTNYQDDVRISDESLKGANDTYRKVRNTMRYMVGALQGWEDTNFHVSQHMFTHLDQYIMAKIRELESELHLAAAAFDFSTYTNLLIKFMNEELSAFYFDVMKDVLYCSNGSNEWYVYRHNLMVILMVMVGLWQPILPFLCEEVYQDRLLGPEDSYVNDMVSPALPRSYGHDFKNAKVKQDWENFFTLRNLVNAEVEKAVVAGVLKSSFEASLEITVPAGFYIGFSVGLAQYLKVAVVKTMTAGSGLTVVVSNANYDKCERCRLYYDKPQMHDKHLCVRCEDRVKNV